MVKRSLCAAAVAACSLSAVGLRAEQAAPMRSAVVVSPFVIPFEKVTLDNGLEVILHQDRALPLVAVNLWYHVGPANEPPGRSGFAHLFEHLMFEGSRHVGREFDRLLESAGATRANGTTSWDRTNYYETVPRQHLELVLWLESDRMGFMIDAIDAERLEIQRDVVKNERRQTYENSPYGPSSLAMYDLLFPAGHPYHGAVIGSMEDLSRATLEDVRSFFASYYAPSNATLAIAGDFDVAEAKALVERYFGTLPKRPPPAATTRASGALAEGRRIEVEEPVELARFAAAWLTPPAFSPDAPALDISAAVLGGGRATRLYQELVVKRRLCSEVSVWVDTNSVVSTFSVEAMVAQGADVAKVEAAVLEIIAKLAAEGPSDAELRRAKAGIDVATLSSLQLLNGDSGESGRAGLLQRMNHYLADPGRLPQEMDRVRRVSAADVQRVLAQHLGSKVAVVVTRPARKAAAP